MQVPGPIKKILKGAYMCGRAVALSFFVSTNFALYHAVLRTYNTTSIHITDSTDIISVINSAEGDDLEEKANNVISERLDFDREEVSDNFKGMLFSYLSKETGFKGGDSLSLEEKINYARKFSATLDYNHKANWLETMVFSENKSFFNIAGSFREYNKINNMSAEEVMKYKAVVCVQYARVFASALNLINESSLNKDDIHVAVMSYVPNDDENLGEKLNLIVSFLNAVAFGEYRVSGAHAVNVVITKDKFYLIEPQQGVDDSSAPVDFMEETLEIDNDYVRKVR